MQRERAVTIYPKGWMEEFLQRDKAGITGNLDRLCPDASSDIFGENRTTDHIKDYWSSWWPGETEGNWTEAYVRLAIALKDEVMMKRAREMVYHLIRYQGEDGYIGIYVVDNRYSNGRRSGDLWTQSRVMNAMLVYYEYTKDPVVLTALERMADLSVTQYGPTAGGRSFYQVPDEEGSKGHGLMFIESLLKLYRYRKKKEYLDFCEFLYQDYSTYPPEFPGGDIRDVNLINPKIPFISHGPHTCEQMRVLIQLYEATGKEIYLMLFQAAEEKLKKNMLLSGSCKSDEQIGVYLSEVPEEERNGGNFGVCTVLPGNGFEYCSTTELMFTFLSALRITGDLHYADMEEWMIHNAAMAARQHDGKAIQYLCADNLYEASRAIGERWDYSPTHTDAAVCCAPNSCKVMPAHVSALWMEMKEGLTAVLYGPCILETQIGETKVRIEEDTAYPFEHTVRFRMKLSETATFPLRLRIPGWASGASVEIRTSAGERFFQAADKIQQKKEQSITLCRKWQDGEEVILSFEAEIQMKPANDKSVALSYGPLLYAKKIETEAETYFSYEVEGFYDINYYPAQNEKWDYTIKINPRDLEENAEVCHEEIKGYPWEQPPVSLKVRLLDNRFGISGLYSFVPIGCTILRRTTFPVVYVEQE